LAVWFTVSEALFDADASPVVIVLVDVAMFDPSAVLSALEVPPAPPAESLEVDESAVAAPSVDAEAVDPVEDDALDDPPSALEPADWPAALPWAVMFAATLPPLLAFADWLTSMPLYWVWFTLELTEAEAGVGVLLDAVASPAADDDVAAPAVAVAVFVDVLVADWVTPPPTLLVAVALPVVMAFSPNASLAPVAPFDALESPPAPPADLTSVVALAAAAPMPAASAELPSSADESLSPPLAELPASCSARLPWSVRFTSRLSPVFEYAFWHSSMSEVDDWLTESFTSADVGSAGGGSSANAENPPPTVTPAATATDPAIRRQCMCRISSPVVRAFPPCPEPSAQGRFRR
jgi:hypothetical protein